MSENERREPFVVTPDDEARFLSYVDKQDSGCWLWTGSLNNGYGQFSFRSGNWRAHRWAYRRYVGPLTGFVCHRCDKPACVNPAHLFIGDQMANMRDAAKKGRLGRGEGHWNARLSRQDIIDIRASDEPQTALGPRYGVHPKPRLT